MSEKQPINSNEEQSIYSREVGAKAVRRLKGQRNSADSVWFGLGMTGLIGWSVVVPTLGGAALGIWLDKLYPGIHSWTMTMLVTGLAIGCFSAWHWVAEEEKAMQEDNDE